MLPSEKKDLPECSTQTFVSPNRPPLTRTIHPSPLQHGVKHSPTLNHPDSFSTRALPQLNKTDFIIESQERSESKAK